MIADENNGQRARLGANLTHGLLDALGRAIVAGVYDDTPFPTEAELSEQHGVSRSVTREAVKMLTAKGLLRARPRQGTIVQPVKAWNLFDGEVLAWLVDGRFSVALLRQLNQLRAAIEPEAAALAARFASPADVRRLQAALARLVETRQGRGDKLEAAVCFHTTLLQASANPFYAQFQPVVATALRMSSRPEIASRRRPPAIGPHQAVYDAIVRRDPSDARAAMSSLIDDTLEAMDPVAGLA